MCRGTPVPHFEHVDITNTKALFFENNTHRAYLRIPFFGERGTETLCVIGQNPSAANEIEADKTIRYLERLIYLKYPQYGQIIIVNLYSQVDTLKNSESNPLHPECEKIFKRILDEESNFLMVYGKLSNQGMYRFLEKAKEIKSLLSFKNLFKLDIGTSYAPHPGNPRVIYNNFNLVLNTYEFTDII